MARAETKRAEGGGARVRGLRTARLVGLIALAAFALRPSEARAHGGGVATELPAPPPTKGETSSARALVDKLEADAKGKPFEAVLREPLGHAKRALKRAHGARASGDATNARLLDDLALEWAKTAEAFVRAAKAEEAALLVARETQETETQLGRARALLAETQARQGLAAAELDRVKAEAAAAAQAAAEAEEARRAKATKKKGSKR